MKKSFLDTNIFIETYVRVGPKSDSSFKLLNSGANLYTNSLVISEMEWVMRVGYEIAKQDIVRGIRKILTSNIEVDNKQVLLNTLEFFESHNVDWTDCLNMFFLKEEDVSEVYSYDKGLQKFSWIKRLEP